MCKAPKLPKPKEPKKPQFLRNRYLDEIVGNSAAVNSLKTGRGSLRIPAGVQAIGGRQPGESLVPSGGAINPAPSGVNPIPQQITIRPGTRDRGVNVQRR